MIARLFVTLSLIFSLLFQSPAALPPRRADDVKMKAVLISDIHSDADFTRERTNLMRQVFFEIGRTQGDSDTVVMSGDLTNSGDLREYINLQNCLNAYCRIGDRVPEMGNHDSWHHSDDPDYEKAEKYFKMFCSWNGIKTDKVYYSKEVCGIPFIMLGVEAGDFGEPYHSEEQMNWFEEEITAAVSRGKPVFVICHKPLEDMGGSAQRMESILMQASENAAAPVIYVSGHCHEIGENTYAAPNEKLIYLNLPSVLYTEDGGLGFTAEVTDTSVILTGINFLEDRALDGYTYIIEY
ncbi:MAG: metallophosphoesterase [Clostridia bacterium]|nr:metallophosphoesterase [Clostridia bacterium]